MAYLEIIAINGVYVFRQVIASIFCRNFIVNLTKYRRGVCFMKFDRSFILGLLCGMAAILLVNFAISPIRSHMMWSGVLSPEAKIMEIYSILTNNSIIPFERDVLLDNMYRGMLEGVGDPYTYYFNREALSVFMERTEGSYAGVGMVVTTDQYDSKVTVVNVFVGSPAEEAGLLPGDKIVAVDGADMSGKLLDEVIALVRGLPGTQVKIGIIRGEDTLEISIIRQQINVPTVHHNMMLGGIAYIRIESFDGVTYAQFTNAYRELRAQGMRGLIIDLRNNPGGRLETVVDIGSLILPAGAILYSENVRGERTVYRSERDNRIDVPLVILVNGGSASASEVLTGAVRDHGVGTVVGQQTFGKGVVQSLFPVSDGSAVKVTIARYYTPNGISIHGTGITPDYIVEVDRETAIMSTRLSFEEDIQLQKAVEVMNSKLD